MKRMAPDPLAEFRGPDGEIGTDGPWIEKILDARDAAAEAIVEEDDVESVELPDPGRV